MSKPSVFVEFFGPSAWKFMHSVSFTFPEQPDDKVRKQYKDFFRSIRNVLPCPSCAHHYRQYMDKHPIDVTNRATLSRWVYDLHEDVNRRSHKSGMSWEQVQKNYTGWTNDQMDSSHAATIKKLGDPHFGQSPEIYGQMMNSGSSTTSTTGASSAQLDNLTKILIGIVALTFIIFALVRIKQIYEARRD